MVKRAARKGLDLIAHRTDIAETKVYMDGVHLGHVRERYTPERTFDAWAHGRLLGGYPTIEEAVQTLVKDAEK